MLKAATPSREAAMRPFILEAIIMMHSPWKHRTPALKATHEGAAVFQPVSNIRFTA
jgi:hypothetical protein